MSVTSELILATVSGTPVVMFPVPTPWPFSAGCDSYIYRQNNNRLILAFDPMYPSIIEATAQSCFRTEVSSWWFQPTTAIPSTALGPTFVCPESYNAVYTTVLESKSEAQTQYTYCCPPKFSLGAIFPPNIRSVAQCTSTMGAGGTISYRSFSNADTALPASTVVSGSPATVFAPPVNGYNIVQRQVLETSSTRTTESTATRGTTGTSTITTPAGGSDTTNTGTSKSKKVSTGAIAGAVVGGVLGLVAILTGIVFLIRRRRQAAASSDGQDKSELAGESAVGVGRDGTKGYYAGITESQELPQESYRHELGGQEDQRFELPTHDTSHPPPANRGG